MLSAIVLLILLSLLPLTASELRMEEVWRGIQKFQSEVEPDMFLKIVGQLDDDELNTAVDMNIPLMQVKN
jgi:hypothetical protein